MDFEYGRFYMTEQGILLQAKAQSGLPLRFTKLGIGDGLVGQLADMTKLKKLVHMCKDYPIREVKNNGDGSASVNAAVSNDGVTQGFFIRELGLFADDPDIGEILYAVCNNGDQSDFLAPRSMAKIDILMNVITVVGNAQNLQVVVNDNAVFALQSDFEKLAGKGWTVENVKENNDLIRDLRIRLLLLEANLSEAAGKFRVDFVDISEDEVLNGVWDKEGRRMVI